MDTDHNFGKPTNIILSGIIGIISFLVGGIIANIFIIYLDAYIIALLISGAVGAFLFALVLSHKQKILHLAISGCIGLPAGLMASFAIIEGAGALIPSLGRMMEDTMIPDLLVQVLMGIVLGLIAGAIIYGRKAMLFFAAICGLAGIPGGLALAFMNSNQRLMAIIANLDEPFNKTDANLLVITSAMGLGFGLAVSMYNKKRR